MDLENDILQTARTAINDAIIKELSGYDKPLSNLVKRVINSNEDDLFKLVNDEFSSMISGDVFRESLKQALNDKIAKILVSRMGGELEKRVNELKSSPTTRAKITIAIEKCISEI